MSWCDAGVATLRSTLDHGRRSYLRTWRVGAVALALSLGACADGTGFRPLYGTLGNGAAVEQKMAQVDIGPIPGKNGQRIRNELVYQTTGGGNPAPPVYRLDVAIRESTTTTLIVKDGNAAGQIYQIEAKFQLIRISDKKVMLEGNSHARAVFERAQSVYSNVRANDDSAERASKTIATDLKSRLAAFLSQDST